MLLCKHQGAHTKSSRQHTHSVCAHLTSLIVLLTPALRTLRHQHCTTTHKLQTQAGAAADTLAVRAVTRLRAVAALAAGDSPLAAVLCKHALTLRTAAVQQKRSRPNGKSNGHTDPAEGDTPTASDSPEDEETVQCLLLLAVLLQQRAAAAVLVPDLHSSGTSSSGNKKKAAGNSSSSVVQDLAAAVAALRSAVAISTGIAQRCGHTVGSSTNSGNSSSSSVHTPVLRLLAQAQLALLQLLTSFEETRRTAVEAQLPSPSNSSSNATNTTETVTNTSTSKGLPSRGAAQWGLRSSAKRHLDTTAIAAFSYVDNSEQQQQQLQWYTQDCALADQLLQLVGCGHVITDVTSDVSKGTATGDIRVQMAMLVPQALLCAGKAYAQLALLQDSAAVARAQQLLVAAAEAAAGTTSSSSQSYSTVREACMAIAGLLVNTAATR
jgi:hypothetical protein